MKGLHNGEPWDASDDFDSHAAAPLADASPLSSNTALSTLRAPESGPDAFAAAAKALPHGAAVWRRGGCGSQLT